jgi:hypothetical protein
MRTLHGAPVARPGAAFAPIEAVVRRAAALATAGLPRAAARRVRILLITAGRGCLVDPASPCLSASPPRRTHTHTHR